ncbi:ATP-binding protein [Parvularcula maris]|uniref:histidine kinase n=1 Tax=Parvularcula maris TaxID=2965077 RepID=A0A9X2RJQ4_9PROT|nr:ATP-binding protein [Parvularcula maris]MCQ8184983.1 ATP-binding protein [Parvularcula maris]
MRALVRGYEAFLRIGPELSPWDRTRARGVYVYAWLFLAYQLVNLGGMTYSYGGWVIDHTASVVAAALFLAVSACLRWTKNFALFLIGYCLISLAGFLASSFGAGIYSSLVPQLVLGSMMAAFVFGWQAALLVGSSTIAVLCLQLGFSLSGVGAEAVWTEARTQQRFLQAVYAVGMGTAMSALLSYSCQKAMRDLDRARRKAEDLAQAKSDFLATMSHELRTPMNGVLGLTEALLSGEPGKLDGEQPRLLGHIKGSGEHLLSLLNDVLDFSKIEAGKMRIEPRVFDLHALLEAVRMTYLEPASAKGLRLELVIGPGLPKNVRGDDRRVRQVLNNLVSNAVKFTEAGSVRLLAERGDDDEIVFRVRDTGPGIPKEAAATIFEPFEQGQGRRAGTGLGLSICVNLCEQMGGSILLEATGNGGSCFRVELRLPAAEEEGAARILPSGDLRLAGLKVLVAEDNTVNCLVLEQFLKLWGMKGVFAEHGAAALELLEAGDYDLMLVDRQMPVMDGVATTRAVRARGDAKASIPIIAVTADVFETGRNAMAEAGADGFVGKPLNPEELLRAIGKVLPEGASPASATEVTG